MEEQRLNEQVEPINSSFVVQDVAWKTSQERCTIGTSGERMSGRSVLSEHDMMMVMMIYIIYIYIYIYIYIC